MPSTHLQERNTSAGKMAATPNQGCRAKKRAETVQPSLATAIVHCSLGNALIAISPAGIAAILLGDEAATLQKDLRGRFPKTPFIAAGAGQSDLIAAATLHIEDPANGPDLPLDIRGTAFQKRVWQELQKIPPGTTSDYAMIAKAIGKPNATRAVARACASNAHAVVIPCHRVIRKDGGISGYRWGIARKRALLKREQA